MRILLFIGLVLFASMSHAASISANGERMIFVGDIKPQDAQNFAYTLIANEGLREVAIESRGGDLGTAMQIGRIVRRAQLNTVAIGECYSACTLIFVSGKTRQLEGGEIGFHRVRDAQTGEAVALEDVLYNRLTMFAWARGIDPVRFIQWMALSPENDLFVPSETELCQAKIIKPCE